MAGTVDEIEGVEPVIGWHVLHLFYRVDRAALSGLMDRQAARGAIADALTSGAHTIAGLQCYAILGHKADFGVILADADPRKLRDIQTAIAASPSGGAIELVYSFTSITEVSEYVPDAEAYARILVERERMDPESAGFKTRVAQYAARLEAMNKHRIYPEFPAWPYVCFYPMNKMRRAPDQNWYLLPFEERMEMMTEHGKSGMKFGGKVTQVITASTGLDDWEWGVTLWAKNPSYLKDIVYTMRFDRASAQYAEFGPFYPGYIMKPSALIDHIRL